MTLSPGPLRRITAAIGLLAMVPIAVMVLTAALTPQEAALRAVVLVLAVLLVGNLVRVIITQLLHRVERELPDVVAEHAMPAAATSGGVGAPVASDGTPRRRVDDQVDATSR